MKRDWQCIRDILVALEAKPTGQELVRAVDLKVWDDEVFAYHVNLLREAGLIEAICRQQIGGGVVGVARALTWEGHELLDRLRSDALWNEIRREARDRGLDLSFEVVKLLAAAAIQKLLGNPHP